MSKGAVKAFVGPLAVELAPLKIRLNSISPGITRTPMTDALAVQYPNLVKMFERVPPLGRMVSDSAVFFFRLRTRSQAYKNISKRRETPKTLPMQLSSFCLTRLPMSLAPTGSLMEGFIPGHLEV